jgi:predicted NACHT family NTPase
LASNLLDSDRELVDQFFSRLLKLPGLFSVVRVPLLGTLTILLFKHLHDLPDSRNKLYSMFIDLLLGGWNLAKGMKRETAVASNTKLAALTRLAGMMHSAKQKECSANLFVIALKDAGSLKTKEEAVLSELVEDAMLVLTGRDTYMFPHLSFQEFLAARDIAEPSGSMASQCLLAFLQGDDWWREVLFFFIGMTARPKRIEAWVAKHVQRAREMNDVNIPDVEVRAQQLYDQLLLAFPTYTLSVRTVAHGHRIRI